MIYLLIYLLGFIGTMILGIYICLYTASHNANPEGKLDLGQLTMVTLTSILWFGAIPILIIVDLAQDPGSNSMIKNLKIWDINLWTTKTRKMRDLLDTQEKNIKKSG